MEQEVYDRLIQEFISIKPQRPFQEVDENQKGIGFILNYLCDHQNKEVTAGQLAKALHVSTARIAVLLNKMTKYEYIERSLSTNDARKTIVTISNKGIEEVNKFRKKAKAFFIKIIDEVGVEDIEEFIRINKKINESIALLNNKE